MNRWIHKGVLFLLLGLVLLTLSAPATAWGQTGPLPTNAAPADQYAEASKVHLIVTGFATGTGNDIGPECRADLIAVQSLFCQAFVGPWRSRLEVHALYGEVWTAERVRQFLREVQVGANDVVVFYHAGHGGIRDADRPVETHVLQVNRQEFVLREEVRDLLLARHCRGVIVLTDCCSTLPSTPQVVGPAQGPVPAPPSTEQAVARLNRATVRNLFLRFRGLVDITAAEVGQGSANGNLLNDFGGARGAFTTAFLRLASSSQVFAGWADFYPALRELTHTSSGRRHRAHAFALREETAAAPASAVPGTGPLAQ